MPSTQRQGGGRTAVWVLLLVAVYFVTGRLGLTLAYYNRMATLLWAPSGLAVAALWLGGRRMIAGAFFGSLLVNLSIGASPVLALALALGNSCEALIADTFVERAGLRRGLHTVRDVIVFVGLVVSVPTAFAAANAGLWLTVLAKLPLDRLLPTVLTWWLGDAGGVLVVAPLVLAFRSKRVERSARATEGVLLAVLAPGIASISFGLVLPGVVPSVTLALLPFPILIWAALRFGFRGATVATAVVTLVAVIGTVAGTGPFRSGNPHVDVASLWSLLAALSITALLLAASLEEREREARVRRDRERWLSVAVDASHAVAIERDLENKLVRIPRSDDELVSDWIDAPAFNERIEEEDRARIDEAVANSVDGWECEYRVVEDGEVRHKLERARVVERDANGRPVRAVGLCRDITERRRAEEERLALQKELEGAKRLSELGLLAGGIAHDFNNLLVVVRANADLVRLGGERYMAEGIDAIDQAAVRAAELTDQLLAYAGRRPMRRRELDVGALATETIRMLRPTVSSRIALDVDAAIGVQLVEGDPAQLRQVLLNLVLNAVQAIEGEGRVTVRVAKDADTIVLEVRDTGRGMDEETRARVFQPFFSTKEQGRGLGMAAVFGIVRSHKGNIDIASRPGEGTVVCVTLPAADRVTRVHPNPQPAPSLRNRRRVLVIDEGHDTRANVRRQLAEAGWEVTVAGSHGEAHERLSDSGPFEVALVDAAVVDTVGRALHAELRHSWPDLPLVLMSECDPRELGPVPLLRKPFRDVDLLARLQDALAITPPFAPRQRATAAE